jgi:thymidylate kinase
MIIGFIGFDGTGKSTITKNLKSLLEKNTNKDVEIVHGFNHLFLDFLTKRLENTKAAKLHNSASSKKSILSYIWPFCVFLDSFFLYFYYKKKYANKILILDRYFYDYIPSYEYLKVDKIGLLKVLFSLIPKADYMFSLTVDPQKAYSRKVSIGDIGNADLNYFKKQKKRYDILAEKLNIETIDTGKDAILSTINHIYVIISKKENLV